MAKAKKSGVASGISFTVGSDLSNPALFVKSWGDAGVNVSVDGKALDNFKVGYAKKMDNDDLVLWLGNDFKAGAKVVKSAVKHTKSAWHRYMANPKKQIKFKSGKMKGRLNLKAMAREYRRKKKR